MDPKYPVVEELITMNRPRTPLAPSGIVVHATADPGATAQNEHDYFNSGYRKASAHLFADWTEIVRTIPENEVAWHAGPTANSRFLSVEMCEPEGSDPAKFTEVWDRTVWLVADACVRHGWNPATAVWSHKMVSDTWHETDHTDPVEYLAEYGRSWGDLVDAVETQMAAMVGVLPEPAPAPAPAVVEEPTWEEKAMARAKAAGLIGLDHDAEKNPTWAEMLQVVLNLRDQCVPKEDGSQK